MVAPPLACVAGAVLAWRVAPARVRRGVGAAVALAVVGAGVVNARLNALAEDLGGAYRAAKKSLGSGVSHGGGGSGV